MNLIQLSKQEQNHIEDVITLIKNELDLQATSLVNYRNKTPIDDIDLLSTNLNYSNLPKTKKELISNHQNNIKKYIYTTSQLLENKKYKDIDKTIDTYDIGKKSQNELKEFMDSIRKLSYSLRALDVMFYSFIFVNKIFSARIKNNNYEDTLLSDMKQSSKNLSNCIFIYELATYLKNFLNNFEPLCLKELYKTLKEKEKKILEWEENIKKQKDKTNIDKKLAVFKKAKQKHKHYINLFKSYEKDIKQVKKSISKLEMIQESAYNQIGSLNELGFYNFTDGIDMILSEFNLENRFDMEQFSLLDAKELLLVGA
jgi:putative methionine-R-sulfoxide reductase with GAF domain